jgi:hypothetical protein
MRRALEQSLAFSALLLAASCGGPDINENRTPLFDAATDGEASVPDAMVFTEGGEPCPDSIPKIGEGCPPGFSEGNVCTFQVGQCTVGGVVYDDFTNYCCVGGLWTSCGGTPICTNALDDAAVPDDASAGDGRGETLDDASSQDAGLTD